MTSLITATIAIKPKMTHEMKCKVCKACVHIYIYTDTCTNNIKNQDKLRQNRPIAGFKGTQKPVKIARSSRLIKQFPNRRGTLQKRGDSEKDLSPLDFKWKCGQD